MSILTKLKAQQAQPAPTPAPVVSKTKPMPRPEVMPPAPSRTVAQGRRRKHFAKSAYEVSAVKSVSLWASERLEAAEGNAVYIGSGRVVNIRNKAGARQKLYPQYERTSLHQDFTAWMKARNWPMPPVGKTFAGLILKWCLENGIPAHAERTYRQRRKIIRGIAIVGTQGWDGNEASL